MIMERKWQGVSRRMNVKMPPMVYHATSHVEGEDARQQEEQDVRPGDAREHQNLINW